MIANGKYRRISARFGAADAPVAILLRTLSTPSTPAGNGLAR
jgi:hypothetical protein